MSNMADIKPGLNQLFLREEELRQAIELLFFAYRDFTAEPDASWPSGTSGGPTTG